jgi:hypothetical protein
MKVAVLTYNFLGIPLFSKKFNQRLSIFTDELRKLQPEIRRRRFGFSRYSSGFGEARGN